jgi:hypothetical protein
MEKKNVQDSLSLEMQVQDNEQDGMEDSIVRKIQYKSEVMKSILQIVNEICEQKKLQYFAIGKLLTQCIYEQDSYPDRQTYMIAMLRKDYDIFWQTLKASEIEGIELYEMYASNGEVCGLQSYIRKTESFTDDKGELDITIDLRIECYEYLPTDSQERQDFYQKIANMSREYRAMSRYMSQRQNSFTDKVKRKLKKKQLYTDKHFEKQNLSYRANLNKYAKLDNPQYVGRVELLIYDSHRLDTIFPIQKKAFLGTELMIPNQYEKFCTPIKTERDQSIFEERLRVLKCFDQLCMESHLQYFAMGDLARSCAVGGDSMFDKELSVWRLGMPREDYEKILDILK